MSAPNRYRPGPAAVVIALGCILAVIGLLVLLWPNGTTQMFEAPAQSMTLSMAMAEATPKGLSLSLSLPPDARDADRVFASVRYILSEETRYPGSASGEFSCNFQFFLNGSVWAPDEHHGWVVTKDPDPDHNWPDKTRIRGPTLDSSKPEPQDRVLTDRISTSGANEIRTTLTCIPETVTTGPTVLRVTYGPLTAFVTS